jgi:hypothetical protein
MQALKLQLELNESDELGLGSADFSTKRHGLARSADAPKPIVLCVSFLALAYHLMVGVI